MRIFPTTNLQDTDRPGTRNVQIDSVHKEVFNYSERIAADPRIKKYAAPNISESDIRHKLKAHQLKKEEEQRAAIESAKLNAAKKEEVLQKVEAGAEPTSPADISLNDPKDPNTRGKLKEAVKMGTFNFSEKERQVLQQILNKEE